MYDAFEYKKGISITKTKIEAMEVFNDMLCYGDSEGVLYLSQIKYAESELVCKESGMSKKVCLICDITPNRSPKVRLNESSS